MSEPRRIAFILPSLSISGGHYVVLEQAAALRRAGFAVTLFSETPLQPLLWHPELLSIPILPLSRAGDVSLPFDLAFATAWQTVYQLPKLRTRRYGYFVQSLETRFCSAAQASEKHKILATYNLGMPLITITPWLVQTLSQMQSAPVRLARNGIHKHLYHIDGTQMAAPARQGLRVLVEGPVGVWYKNTARTIRLCRQADVGEVWLLTASDINRPFGVDKLWRQQPIDTVPSIYRSCDVLVKLSYVEGMFAPPLEMFHCGGTAVIYDVTGAEEYIRHNHNALVVPAGMEQAVVASLRQLAGNPDQLATLRKNAEETALQWPDWQTASLHFVAACRDLLDLPENTNSIIEQLRLLQLQNKAANGLCRRLSSMLPSGLSRIARTAYAANYRQKPWLGPRGVAQDF